MKQGNYIAPKIKVLVLKSDAAMMAASGGLGNETGSGSNQSISEPEENKPVVYSAWSDEE